MKLEFKSELVVIVNEKNAGFDFGWEQVVVLKCIILFEKMVCYFLRNIIIAAD